MATELEELLLLEQRYKVELLRDQIEKMQATKAQQLRNRQDQARTEEFNRRKVAKEQSLCAHKKGGRGIEGIFTGNDANYSVVKHTEPWGETYCKCQRCGKEWRDPYFMLRKLDPAKVSAARKKAPKEYARIMKEYQDAMNWPTDNSPSGGAIFGIQREAEYDEVA